MSICSLSLLVVHVLMSQNTVGVDDAVDASAHSMPATETAPTPNLASPSLVAQMGMIALGYADHLFSDGDYYRAISEYRRYLFLTKGRGNEAFRAAMAIGEAYLRSRQLEAAASQFESVAKRSQDEQVRSVALLSAGRAHLLDGRALMAATRLAEARVAAAGDSVVGDEALFLLAWARMDQNDYDSAESAFRELAGRPGPRQHTAQQALVHLDGRDQSEEKSVLLAAVLSLLPGLGHMYLGQWSVGVAALFWNALFAAATGYSIYSQEWGVAAVLAVFELTWYTGTMFGALNGAFRHNKSIQENWLDDFVGELGRSREIDAIVSAPGLPGDRQRLLPQPSPRPAVE